MAQSLASEGDRVRRDGASQMRDGVLVLDTKQARIQRWVVLILTVLPFGGLVAAFVWMWGRGLTYLDVILFMAMYLVTGLGVTVGFHRLFAHRSFVAARPLKIALAICGSMAFEGPVITWVADHRRHHAYADKSGDPHSPHAEVADGLAGLLRGLWHAHMGWFFTPERSLARRWAPDLLKDDDLRRLDRQFPVWVLLSLIVPAGVGFAFGGWRGASFAFLWGGLARMFFVHHVTWSVNSICHFYGKRPFNVTDMSTNNWLLALPSLGESWHNNHHAFPSSALSGFRPQEIDISGAVILALHRMGLVDEIKKPSGDQLAARRRRTEPIEQ